MKFSVWPSFERPWDELLHLVTAAESAGWFGCWYADHLMPNTEDGTPADGVAFECWSVLAALAASTRTVRLGSLVSPVTFHHPVVLAKRATTVDHISGGRAVLGIGAGWQVNEHGAIGVELVAPKPRVDRFEEAIEIVHRVRTEPRVTTDGSFFRATDLPFDPKPVGLRLMVGSSGARMMGITAKWADEWNVWGTPETVGGHTTTFLAACERVGRDPGSVHRSTQALTFLVDDVDRAAKLAERVPADRSLVGSPEQLVEQIGRYAELGVDEFILPDFTLGSSAEQRLETFHRFDAEVASHFA
jgi:alkanesulfonate monooxygenase SsuD/methylene tetrahydromethanopterin reductase-like flavin-dependent oxidoreductase (luciferase family)